MKVIIDRRTWLRGEGGDASFLRRASDGKQCCIGFVARKLGQTVKDIIGRETLWTIDFASQSTGVEKLLQTYHIDKALRSAMDLNDVKDLASTTREWAIQQALAPLGLDLEFVN